MNGLIALNRLVAGRGGDGLDPRLRVLLEERQRIEDGMQGVVDMERFRGSPVHQAGPHPAAGKAVSPNIPREGVLRFPQKRSRTAIGVQTKTSSIK